MANVDLNQKPLVQYAKELQDLLFSMGTLYVERSDDLTERARKAMNHFVDTDLWTLDFLTSYECEYELTIHFAIPALKIEEVRLALIKLQIGGPN